MLDDPGHAPLAKTRKQAFWIRLQRFGPLCGLEREFCTRARIRIAVLGAQSAPKRHWQPVAGSAGISRAEPVTGLSQCTRQAQAWDSPDIRARSPRPPIAVSTLKLRTWAMLARVIVGGLEVIHGFTSLTHSLHGPPVSHEHKSNSRHHFVGTRRCSASGAPRPRAPRVPSSQSG
jgi:hypothetical protein